MKLNFNAAAMSVEIEQLVIAGWAGRDEAAVNHHIEELAAIGVPRPSRVPLFYRVAANQLSQAATIQVVGPDSSGEAEVLVFTMQGETWVSLCSDHTDRKLEAHSVALSKQICAKPCARDAWRMSELIDHWDRIELRSSIVENEGGAEVSYQQGTLAGLRRPDELVSRFLGPQVTTLPAGVAMSCGTVAVIGGIRPARSFRMELHDPVLGRGIGHRYAIDVLDEVS